MDVLDKDIESAADDFVRQIFEGKLHSKQIHHGLYSETAKKLINGISGSFGKSFAYDSPANAALDYMQTNIFAFSAAKNMTEFEAFSKLLVKDGEKIPGFKKFKEEISALNIRYNERYLNTEYNSAIAQGQMAAKWQEFEANREAGEYLEYRTAGDERVRASHKALNGKIFHIDDKILERIYPPNDWSCRCIMVQVPGTVKPTPTKEHSYLERQASIPKYFRNNVGKTGMVYTDGHPYFNALGKPGQLKAVDNYNLWEPSRIYNNIKKLSISPKRMASMDDFVQWHKHRIKTGPGEKDFAFECNALNKLWLTFDEDLFKRVRFSKKYVNEKRFQLAPLLEDTIAKPDEIWTLLQNMRFGSKTELESVLVKYYKDKPFIVIVKTSRDRYIRISSFYELDDIRKLGQWRRGILRYKK